MARKRSVGILAGAVVGVLLCATGLWAAEKKKAEPPQQKKEAPVAATVQDGVTVQMDYTLTVEGKEMDSSKGHGPLSYVHGSGQIIPGLEKQLTGLHVGDEKEVTVKPEDGYGEVDPKATMDLPKTQLPPDLKPEVGQVLNGTDQSGRPVRATIMEVGKETVKLNLNHPLAGKTLVFKVKVVDVSPASQPK